jgi:L-iditol 2-dehydrogenase
MKAAVLAGIRRFESTQIPQPIIRDDHDVLIKICTIGVCGSDVHYYTTGRIGTQIVEFPFVIGHEAAGIVEAVGKHVTRVRPGQRIAIDPAVSCGHCDQCRAGRDHTCRSLRFMGCPKQIDGCLAEYVVLPESSCFPIPANMTFEQATLTEPLAIGVYAVEKSSIRPASTAAILGVGPIGMSVFFVLRTKSIGNIYVTDKIENRLTFAGQLNPAWRGNPERVDVVKGIAGSEPLLLDVVYECSGDPAAVAQGLDLLKPGGSLVLVGIPETDVISFPIHELRRKEITIINIRRQVHCTQKAIDLVASGTIHVDGMATHRFTLDQTPAAFELVSNYQDGVMKAIISVV